MIRNFFVLLFLGSFRLLIAQSYCTPKEVQTEILIHSSADSIWQLLTAFDEYPQWNPFIKEIKGELKLRSKLSATIVDEDSSVTTFSAKVLELQPAEYFAWGGSLGFIFKAKHYFILSPVDPNTVKLIQGEYWKGVFGKMYGKKVYQKACYNFNAMNAKMKALLEKK